MSFMKRLFTTAFWRRRSDDAGSPTATQGATESADMHYAVLRPGNAAEGMRSTPLQNCLLNMILLLPGLDETVRRVIKSYLDGTLHSGVGQSGSRLGAITASAVGIRSLTPRKGFTAQLPHGPCGLWTQLLAPGYPIGTVLPPQLSSLSTHFLAVDPDDLSNDLRVTPLRLLPSGSLTESASYLASPLSVGGANNRVVHICDGENFDRASVVGLRPISTRSVSSESLFGLKQLECEKVKGLHIATPSPVHLSASHFIADEALEKNSPTGLYEPSSAPVIQDVPATTEQVLDQRHDGTGDALLSHEIFDLFSGHNMGKNEEGHDLGYDGDSDSELGEDEHRCEDDSSHLKGEVSTPQLAPGSTLEHGGKLYTIHGILGEGSFGRVFYAHTATDDEVAIKAFSKHKMHLDDLEAQEKNITKRRSSALQVTDELEILKVVTSELDAPFLTQLLCSFQDEDNIYFVMKMYSQDFRTCLRRRKHMTVDDIKFYAAELVCALEQLHSVNVMHRDLKPENILVSPTGHLSLADFGMSKLVKAGKKLSKCTAYDYVGTPAYQPPEMYKGFTSGHTYSVDIWGFGLILLEMFMGSGRAFFDAYDRECVDRSVLLSVIESCAAEDCGAQDLLISILLVSDGKLRPTLDQIKQHPFFRKTSWHKVENRRYRPSYIPRFHGPKTSCAAVSSGKSVHKDEKVEVSDSVLAFECEVDLWQDVDHGKSSWNPDEVAPVSDGSA